MFIVLLAVGLAACSAPEENKKEYTEGSRAFYSTELRNTFLDAGLDVKVKVYGQSSDSLELDNILFNDVWERKIEREGYYKHWQDMGFKHVTLYGNRYKSEKDLTQTIVEIR